jgi:8-oxo-dGTP pyrophosphatase MutT (NUDIX family)
MKLEDLIEKIRSYQPITQLETPVSAAVLVMLMHTENNEFYLIVTKRSQSVANYAGDYCFPGGIKESSDYDFEIAVQREVEEELGIAAEKYSIVAPLDDFFDRYHRLVRPYFAVITQKNFERYRNANDEIERVYLFPLSDLSKLQTDSALEKITKRHPAYKYIHDDVIIWGLTASIMIHLYNVIFGENLAVGCGSRD